MFTLIVNEQPVVFYPDTILSLDKSNPLLETDFLPGEYTFPFTVPCCPENDIIFNFAKILSNPEVFEQDYDAQLYIEGDLYVDGVVNIIRVVDGSYEIVFASQMAKLKKAIENKKLSDFELGGVRVIGTTTQDVVDHAKTVIYADPLEYDYTFPMLHAQGFYDGENDDYIGYVNYYDTAADKFPVNTINEDPTPDNQYNLVPCPYLHYLLKQLFFEAGYKLRGEFMDDQEMKQLIILPNRGLDKKVRRYYVKAITTSDFSSSGQTIVFDNESTGGAEDSDAIYDNTTGLYTIQKEGYHTVKGTIYFKSDPCPLLGYNFNHKVRLDGTIIYNYSVIYANIMPYSVDYEVTHYCTAADIGKTIYFDYTSAEATIGGIPNPNFTVLSGSFIEISNDSQSDLNIYEKEINLQNHVPDILATEFLVNIFKMGIKPRFERGTSFVYLDYIDNKLATKKYIDLTKYAEPNPTIEKEKHGGFKVDFDWADDDSIFDENFKDTTDLTDEGSINTEDDLPASVVPNSKILILNKNTIYNAQPLGGGLFQWAYFTDDNRPFVINEGAEDYIVGFSPLLMRNQTIGGHGILLPSTNMVGSSAWFQNGLRDSSSIRVLFYRGMKNNENGDAYPFASSTTKDYAGNTTGNYALKIDSDEGIYENFLKKYLPFIVKSKLVTYDANIPASIFNQIDVFNPVIVDRVFFFIKRMRVDISTTGINKARLELLNI